MTTSAAAARPRPDKATAVADDLRERVVRGRRAARELTARLADSGLELDEWLVLDAVSRSEGLSMSALREATGTDKATLRRRVDALIGRALLYREVDGTDRRVIRVYLSGRGRRTLADSLTTAGSHAPDHPASV